MGLLDTIVGEAKSVVSNTTAEQSGKSGLMEAIMGLISSQGGLQGLLNRFKEKGLGDAVASWIGTGKNLPISGEQLQSVLGSEQVQAIAQKLGMSSSDTSNALADLLPQVVDKLTPDGKVPEGGMIEQGLSLLKGFVGKPDNTPLSER